MRFLTDVKIGRRLGIGFGVTLALMIGMVAVGMVYIGIMTMTLDRIVAVNVAKIHLSNDIRSGFSDLTYRIAKIVMTPDEAAKQEAKKEVDEIRGRYKKSMEQLEKLEINDQGKALIAKLKEEVAKGREANNEVIELALTGKMEDAASKYGELTKVVASYIGAADAIIKWNEERIAFRHVEAIKRSVNVRAILLAFGIISLVVAGLFSWNITRSIVVPILRSSSHIGQMAEGDFSIPVSEHAINRQDELGVFARSMNLMNSRLSAILKQVTSSTSDVAAASTQLSTSAERLSHGASEQTDRITQIAAGSTEMSQAAQDMARNVNSVVESALGATDVAKAGREVVGKVIREVNTMAETVSVASGFVKQLGEQSQRIRDIVTVIDDIADQTNLLALNAAIEAARAGEHGRGFAVVADEVRKLAERTSVSTKEISDMISVIAGGVGKAVSSMGIARDKVATGVDFSLQAEGALENIMGSIDDVYNRLYQIGSGIEEMSTTTDEVAREISKISAVAVSALSSSEEISEAAGGLSGLAIDLEKTVRKFKV